MAISVLLRKMHFSAVQCMPLSDEDLRAHDINAGDHLRNGVLNLHARIYFNEVEIPGIDIDEKLDCSGTKVVGGARNSTAASHNSFRILSVKIYGWSQLDDFLMAPLNGAVAFEEVQDVSELVTQDLHFNVLCARDEALEKNRIIAESCGRFLARFADLRLEFVFLEHNAHTATRLRRMQPSR